MYHILKKNSSMEYFTGKESVHFACIFCLFLCFYLYIFLDDYEKQTI